MVECQSDWASAEAGLLQAVTTVSEPTQPSGEIVALRGHIELQPDARPVVLPQPGRFDRIWPVATLALALALHAAALAAFAFHAPEDTSGAGGQHLEAIEVAIVSSSVLAARESKPTEPAPAAKAEVAPEEGDPSPTDASEQPPVEKPDVAAKVEPKEPEPTPPPKEEQAEPMPKPPEAAPPPPSAQPQSRGGVAAVSTSEGTQPAGGPAAASPGEVSRYAAAVRAALARNKPDGRGRHGTATITFTISAAGAVTRARLTSSSGHPALDGAVLASVERTKFPAPPKTLSERDLTYVIPFRFQ
jgi:protein TonB